MNASILVIEPDPSLRALCVHVLNGLGMWTETAESAETALALLERKPFDAVLAAVGAGRLDDLRLLEVIKRRYSSMLIVVMADSTGTELARQALKLGARECVPKPFKVQELRRAFEPVLEKAKSVAEGLLLPGEPPANLEQAGLIGVSEGMQRVYRLISKVAGHRQPVLILGESGTGKELVARGIHARGPWREQPFVPVDCGALTPTLIESELFGHVRGAFTGAMQSRQGLLAAAGRGTVFLDEVAELPVGLQAKLLRALQEREIRPLGSNTRVHLEARIIAATNQDLAAAIKRGAFRKELYFRLNVVSIKLPPLRERRADIPALVRHFLDRHGSEATGSMRLSDEVMARLMSYDWPGNVRELENCIQRALMVGTPPEIRVGDLPSNLLYHVAAESAGGGRTAIQDLERRAILQALETTGGDRLRAAKLLGIGKTTIYRKLKEYALNNDSDPAPGV